MLHYLLVFLAIQPSAVCTLYCVHRAVPMKKPWLYVLSGTAIMDIFWIFNHFFLPEPLLIFRLIISFSGLLPLPCFWDPGKKLSSLFAYGFMMALVLMWVNLTGQICFAAAPIFSFPVSRLVDMGDPAYIFMSLLIDITVIPLLLLVSGLLKKLLGSLRASRSLFWFLTIPLSQLLLLIIISQSVDFSSSLLTWAVTVLCCLLCVAADFAGIRAYRKLRDLETMTARVRQAEGQLNIQNEYYREMQSSILKINEIRHDLNNQLQSAYYLLEQGHPEEVRHQLDSLKASLRERVGTSYCENLMVDAVLSEKASVCKEHQISLEISAFVPADLPIESAHLCSAFSNLLDNCIAATLKVGAHAGPIQLRTDIRGDYLLIFCSNPALSPGQEEKTDLLRRHGLGLDILSSLAGIYNGNLQTEFSDGIFKTVLTLKLK